MLKYPEDIFRNIDIELKKDRQLPTKGRSSASISQTNTIIGNDFFAEDSAVAELFLLFNTTNGPIELAANA